MIKYLFSFLLPLLILTSCEPAPETAGTSPDRVHEVLDDWHQAASEADFDQYFSYFYDDSSIFMGTDDTERWAIAEFREWSKPYFDRGNAWDFRAVERNVYFSENGKVSWFDEKLDTPNLGPARGSGVLVKEDTTWKIDHYNLSIPIPNAIVDTVVRQIEQELKKEGGGQ